jgi:hypothetical protein
MTSLGIIIRSMSLFGSAKPKGITKEELHFVQGELKASSFGHGAEALNERQVTEIMHRLELCLDADSAKERANNWGQVGADEVATIEHQVADDHALHLSPVQQERLKTVLQKYIDINKHGGAFSL